MQSRDNRSTDRRANIDQEFNRSWFRQNWQENEVGSHTITR